MSQSTEVTEPYYWSEIEGAAKKFQEKGFLGQSDKPQEPAVEEFDGEELKAHGITPPPPLPSIFYSNLAKRFGELIYPQLEIKTVLQDFFIRMGTSCAIPKQRGQRANAVIGITAKGENLNFDYTKYDSIVVSPYKIGERIRLTRELIEDRIYTIVEDQIRRTAKRIVMSIDSSIVDAFVYASKKKWDWLPFRYPSLEKTVRNLAQPEKYVVLLNDQVNPNLPTVLQRLYSSMIPKKAAYLVQTSFDGCYAPVGYFVTKRPLSIDIWPQPTFDSIDVVLTVKYAPVITYPEAITRCRV
jgi:hypothetical protein